MFTKLSPRRIIHLDLDAFFCAVEEVRDLTLRGRAFAVGGRPDARGVVASCSYAARRFGVRSAMPMARALKLCPGLVVVHAHYPAYSEASRQVISLLHGLTHQVEQISIDEAFLDVSDLPGEVERMAYQLQASVREKMGLPCSLGAASNKLVAKIATEVGKATAGKIRHNSADGVESAQIQDSGAPNAVTIVPPGKEAEFLAPLPVEMLWGVGPKTAARLAEMEIRTIGDLAQYPAVDLTVHFGKNGYDMSRHARGIDERPVVTAHEAKSISQEITFGRDVRDETELRKTLRSLAEQVAQRLQKGNLSGTTVKLKLRWPDFSTLTRQATLESPTAQAVTITGVVEQLFEKVWSQGKAVRLLGVGVSGLATGPRQLGLWETPAPPEPIPEKERRLQTVIDELEERFGKGVLTRGAPGKDES